MSLHLGNCLDVMKAMPDNCVDSIVTDPPYHLTTGKKGGTGIASVNLDSPYGRARIGTGFMGKAWDGGDIAQRPETWAECLRLAKPGAFIAAFGGTRTFHRMACAIEDAGWELRDTLMWVYGSGFPKSHNGPWGGTALKPAWEPIILARKPLIGTVASNVQAYGTGGLNIDGCRIEGSPRNPGFKQPESAGIWNGSDNSNLVGYESPSGRWPANLLHDGSDEVVALFPRQSSPAPYVQSTTANGEVYDLGSLNNKAGKLSTHHGDSGSAARFFYCAKADRADRNDGTVNSHPTVKPTDLMRWLCRLITPPSGTVLDPFMGSGSTGRGATLEGFEFIGIEMDPAYIAIAESRIAASVEQRRIDTVQLDMFGERQIA